MTVQKADADPRTLFISPVGNDDSLGEEIPRNFKTVLFFPAKNEFPVIPLSES